MGCTAGQAVGKLKYIVRWQSLERRFMQGQPRGIHVEAEWRVVALVVHAVGRHETKGMWVRRPGKRRGAAASGDCWRAKHTDMFLRPMTHSTHTLIRSYSLSFSFPLPVSLSNTLYFAARHGGMNPCTILCIPVRDSMHVKACCTFSAFTR